MTTQPLAVFPSQVKFEEAIPGTLYVTTVFIQNVSKKAQRIRIRRPRSSVFTLNYFPTDSIAPGLEIQAEIEFMIPENSAENQFVDSIVVGFGDFSLDVPLIGSLPKPRLQVENDGLVDMGIVVQGNVSSKYIHLKNEGKVAAQFRIVGDLGDEISVTPMEGIVEPSGGQKKLNSKLSDGFKVDFRSGETGIFRKCITIEIDNQPSQILDINASVSGHTIELRTPDGPISSEIDFGTLYFGQERDYVAVLVNNGPLTCSYSISFRPESGFELYQNSPRPGEQEEDEGDGFKESISAKSPITANKSKGILNPYQQLPVQFKFHPIQPKQDKGFKARGDLQLYNQVAFKLETRIRCPETDQALQFKFRGVATRPQVVVSQKQFKFGNCPTMDRRDIMFNVTNKSLELPFTFSVKKVAFFHCKPSTGTLLPGQSQNVLMTFSPGQLGSFTSLMHLVINQGIFVVPLKVAGASSSLGEAKQLPGGPDALISDFQPKVKYVDPDDIAREEKLHKKFKRLSPWEKWSKNGDAAEDEPVNEYNLSAKFSLNEEDEIQNRVLAQPTEVVDHNSHEPSYTYAVPDLIRKQAHRDQYADFLKKARTARTQSKEPRSKHVVRRGNGNNDEEDSDDMDPHFEDDMDLEQMGGLSSPRLKVPVAKEPLWTENPIQGVNDTPGVVSVGVKTKSRLKHLDENKLTKKKFKTKPTSQIEIVDCGAVLSDTDLYLVSGGPRTLDFGTVTVNSKNSKCFAVSNDTKQNILVEMDFDIHPELSACFPKSQVVPAGGLAGFDIHFTSTTLPLLNQINHFKKHLSYTINGHHKFSACLVAEIKPAKVTISKSALHMSFDDSNLGPVTSETLTLENTGNAPARYTWVTTSKTICAFTVQPQEGVIEPFGSSQVTVEFRPSANVNKEDSLTLRVRGGYDETLTCVGYVEEPVCVFVERVLDFGTIAVDSCIDGSMELRNTGKFVAIFNIAKLPEGFNCTPAKGKVPPGGVIDIKINVRLKQPVVHDETSLSLCAHLRGGKTVKIPIICESIVPDLKVVETESDFKGVSIGNSSTRTFTIMNQSPVQGVATLNMIDYPEFQVNLSNDNQFHEGDEIGSIFRHTTDGMEDDDELPTEAIADEEGFIRIKVPANRELKLDLVYTPIHEKIHGFNLPLSQFGHSFEHVITAEGLRPKIQFSLPVVNFENKVVSRDRLKKVPTYKDLVVTNKWEASLRWEIGTEQLKDSCFTFKPSGGNLEPGDSCVVKVGFLPNAASQYLLKVPVYLNDDKETEYISCTLMGNGVLPRLRFDATEIILPPVPLGVKSSAVLLVQNDGYDSLELQISRPAESQSIPLSFSYPQGTTLGFTKTELPVEISFMSKKPMSFTANIDFIDLDGKKFSVRVTGTTDNCLLTTYPFISATQDTFGYSPGRPVQYLQTSSKPFLADPSLLEICSEESADDLLRFCNVTLFPIPVQDFPQDLVHSQGKSLFDMIESVSGKRIPGRPKAPSKTKQRETAMQLLEQYTAMLTFLKTRGALLHDVKPEHFLSKEDYVRFRENTEMDDAFVPTNIMKNSGASVSSFSHAGKSLQRKLFERDYPYFSQSAWENVLLQTVKLFLLSRVTPKCLKCLPGFNASNDILKIASGSNIYGNPESLLLIWVQQNHLTGSEVILKGGGGGVPAVDVLESNTVNPFAQNSPIIDFAKDLSNGVVLCTLIAAHFPMFTLPSRVLSSVTLEPTDQIHVENNIKAALGALKEIGLEFIRRDFRNPRDNLIFILFLFQTLPQYIPKADIEFQCSLGSRVTKSIELNNPTNQMVRYRITLDGSDDFTVHEKSILIEPKGTVSVSVQLLSRFSRSVSAVLTLKPDFGVTGLGGGENFGTASALVFRLVSAIHSRKSIKTIKSASRTYEGILVDIQITNPFETDSKFEIQMIQDFVEPPPVKKKSEKTNKKRIIERKSSTTRIENSVVESLPDAFISKTTTVKLRAGETGSMKVQFLPFMPGEYKCQLVFIDDKVGEFLYEIIGTAEKPPAVEKLAFTMEAKSSISKVINITLENKWLEKAKALSGCDSFSGLSSMDPKSVYLNVEFTSPFFKGPQKFCVTSDQQIEDSKKKIGDPLTFEFNPQNAGVYPSLLVLQSKTQVRVIEIEATVTTPTICSEIEFTVPARQEIQQCIPILNTTDSPWTIHATFEGNTREFSGPRSLQVPANGGHAQYPLDFAPSWIGEYNGKLVLKNATTNESMIYTLHGVAKDPLAEDHIVVHVQARTKKQQLFQVPNPLRDSKSPLTFEVQTDLSHVSGPSAVTVGIGATAVYPLEIYPLLGGTYTGTLTFSLGDGKPYVWYTVEIISTSPEPEDTLEVCTFVRKAVAVEITLQNPLDIPVEFDVHLQGHGLLGESRFLLPPKQEGSYQLVYSPLVHGNEQGSISFVNEDIGEIWYKLNLAGQSAEPVYLPEMLCAVGSQLSTKVKLENPTGNVIEIKAVISNRTNFSVHPSMPVIQPYSDNEVSITYSPSSIDVEEEGVVRFSNPNVGQWEYFVSGRGKEPSFMPTKHCCCSVGDTETDTLQFRNPFASILTVNVTMKSNSCFEILQNRSTHSISPFAVFTIPFSFAPRSMNEATASIAIKSETPSMSWTFPISGITEAPSHHEVFNFKCKSRETCSKTILLPLLGLDGVTSPEIFFHDLSIPPEFEQLVENSFVLTPFDSRIQPGGGPIQFQVDFTPLKPFSTTVDLLISRRAGGKWKFQINLVAEQPAIDDVITVQAALHQTSTVSFRLTNRFPTLAPFTASLTVDSAYQFSVYPNSGVLAPLGDAEGTAFALSYTPTEYGKEQNGKLVIVTDEMQWTYLIRGVHPDYVIPETACKVSSKQSKNVLNALAKAQKPRKHNKTR